MKTAPRFHHYQRLSTLRYASSQKNFTWTELIWHVVYLIFLKNKRQRLCWKIYSNHQLNFFTNLKLVSRKLFVSCCGIFRPFWTKLVHEKWQILCALWCAILGSDPVGMIADKRMEICCDLQGTGRDGFLRTTTIKECVNDWLYFCFHDLQ